jgi:hypothetical protein
MKPKRVRKNRQAWPNNIGPWIERLPTEQRAPALSTLCTGSVGTEKDRSEKGR